MTIHMQRDMLNLRKSLLELGALAEEAIRRSVEALVNRDEELAQQVRRNDEVIDAREIEVEESCLKILALNQPVAHDLRFLVTALKMNGDLEIIGDLACNVAKRAAWLARHSETPWPVDIETLAEKVCWMMKESLDALVEEDAHRARKVVFADEEINALKKEAVDKFRELIGSQAGDVMTLLKMMDVPRHLERIADRATDIAQDVVYMVEGEIIRHKDPDQV